jgi:UDP-glucose-4-epimerase GalE
LIPILVVGGAGYIGSHVCKELAAAGYLPIVFDNLTNGHREAVRWGPFVQGDLLTSDLSQVLDEYQPLAVIHLASLIDCRESMSEREKYWKNNVDGTEKLLEAMSRANVGRLVFSSTAAVYGIPEKTPISEDHPCLPVNVYGETKLAAEKLIAKADVSSVILRYFNASGADASSQIGEAHRRETHLIPLTILAGLKQEKPLQIYGNDFPTRDGTAIRDFVHVTDLALAHIQAVEWLLNEGKSVTLNLGSGRGYTVQEVIEKVEEKLGMAVPHQMGEKKISDPPVLVAAIEKAKEVLKWTPLHDLDTIVSSAVDWHRGGIYAVRNFL